MTEKMQDKIAEKMQDDRNDRNDRNTLKKNSDKAEDIYPFTHVDEQDLFIKITHELRCSVCQNQNLTDSMAPLAVSLRQEIYQQIRSGNTEREIIEFVTNRYGDFVLYRPPLDWSTSFLWFGPFVILIMGLLIFKRYLH
jgi:cytochrome c-type biogenesis protein CcmH